MSENTFTPEQEREIWKAFQNNLTISQVCTKLDLKYDDLMAWYSKGDRAQEIERMREMPKIVAKELLMKDMKDNQNVDTAKWVLDRTAKTISDKPEHHDNYSARQELTGKDGTPLVVIDGIDYIKPNEDNTKTDG